MFDPAQPTTTIDDYQPPIFTPVTGPVPASFSPPTEPVAPAEPTVSTAQPVVPLTFNQQTSGASPAITDESPEDDDEDSELLEDQNIFMLLGVEGGSEADKESFLDELQMVIWEDFLENDIELLITQNDMTELKALVPDLMTKDEEQQAKILMYLEKKVPDLEDVLLEKALQLKEDMVRERVSSMKTFFADQPEKLTSIEKAEELIDQDKWRSAAEVLNANAQ